MFAFEYIQILYIPLPINVCIIHIYIGALDTTATRRHLLYGYVYYIICTMRKLYILYVYIRVENAAANDDDDRRQTEITIGTRTLCI